MKRRSIYFKTLSLFFLLHFSMQSVAQYTHPGLNISLSDLQRMKTKVLAQAHPWIDGWNAMLAQGTAQLWWGPAMLNNIGGSGIRQAAANDANAAIHQFLRWYVTGDVAYANNAVRILNAYSDSIKAPVSGELFQLVVWNMVQAGELLQLYPGWSKTDVDRFKNMCKKYFYPSCRDFRTKVTLSSWDGPANLGCLEIGILCDDSVMVNDAISYYKNGAGFGCLNNAVLSTGQVVELGRDNPHAQIGPGSFTDFCAAAWNQGIDLFGYEDNRLLKAYEYMSKFNLDLPVEWTTVDPWFFISMENAYRIFSDITYDMIYNHYVVRKGLNAPYTRAMMGINGLGGVLIGSLCTYADTSTLYAAKAIPPAPIHLTAKPGVHRVELDWDTPAFDLVRGYAVWRTTTPGGPYSLLRNWTDNVTSYYVDTTLVENTTYYYTVSAVNQSGSSPKAAEVSAKPVMANANMKTGWGFIDVNTPNYAGKSSYSPINHHTFSLSATDGSIWGNDRFGFLCTTATGDCMITSRIYEAYQVSGNPHNKYGLMMRESSDPNASYITMYFGDIGPRMGTSSYRTSFGGSVNSSARFSTTFAPTWFRLKRVGNVFSAFQSNDSVYWVKLNEVSVAMNSTYKVGFFVCELPGLPPAKFDEVSIVGGGSVCSCPTTFTASALNSNRIKLTWSAVTAAATYQLSRSTRPTGPFIPVKTDIVTTSYEDVGLMSDSTYYYVLKAANVAGESLDSIRANATTLHLLLPPAPKSLTITSQNNKTVLKWAATEESTLSYNIKRSPTLTGSFVTIGTSDTTTYTDLTAMNDSTYYYAVSAVNELGEGPNSSVGLGKPTLGLLFYYPFNEGTGTASYDLNLGVKATLTSAGATWTTGKFNNAVNLANNGYFALSTVSSSSLSACTISLWVKPTSFAQWARIFDFGTSNTNYMFLTPKGSTGYLRFGILASGGTEQQINTTLAMNTGVWYHLALTFANGVGILYVNGMEYGRNSSMTVTPASLGVTSLNYFGKSQFSSDPYFSGAIDEFRVYRQVLTSSQIQQLYKAKSQTISFDTIPEKHLSDGSFKLAASASSGLAVKYTSSNSLVGEINNDVFKMLTIGSTNVTASQMGNLDFPAALPIVRTVTVTDGTDIQSLETSGMVIYPTIFNDFIAVKQTNAPAEVVKVTLYSTNGMKLLECESTDSFTQLHTQHVTPGLYVVKLLRGNKAYYGKVIKLEK